MRRHFRSLQATENEGIRKSQLSNAVLILARMANNQRLPRLDQVRRYPQSGKPNLHAVLDC